MARIQFVKNGPTSLAPATPDGGEFLQRIKIGEWIHADFRRVRNYKFHKKLFALLQLGFDYWTPVGGLIIPEERQLVNGFVKYLCERIGQSHNLPLSDAAEQFLADIEHTRSHDIALLKSFEAFREWVTIQAGYYTEHIYPDGSSNRRAKSISFASMDEIEFSQLYKSVLNVLWNYILFRKFNSPAEVESIAAQLMEFAA